MNNLSEFLSTLYGTMNNTMSGLASGINMYKQDKNRRNYNILNSDYESFQKIIDLTDNEKRAFRDEYGFMESMSKNGIDENYAKAFLDYVGYDFKNKDIKLETYITSKGLGTETWNMKKLEEANYQQEMNKVLSYVSEVFDKEVKNSIENGRGVLYANDFDFIKSNFISSKINSEYISTATGINKDRVEKILEDEEYIKKENQWFDLYHNNVLEPLDKLQKEARTITNAQTSTYEALYSCLNNGMDLYSTLEVVYSALTSTGIDYVSDKTQKNTIFWNAVNVAIDEKYKQFGKDNWQLSEEEFSSKLNKELETDYEKLVVKYGEDIKSKLLSSFFTNKDNAISNYKDKVETELEIKKNVEDELKNATKADLDAYGDDLSVAINNVSNKIDSDPKKYKDYTLQDFLKEENIDEEKFTKYMENYASATLRNKYSDVKKKFYISNKTIQENNNEELSKNYKKRIEELTKQKKYEFSSTDPAIVSEISDDEIVQIYGFDSYEIYYNNKDKVEGFINDGIRTLQEERNSAKSKLATIKENSKKAKDAETKAIESDVAKNAQRLLSSNDASLMNMSEDDEIKYITSGKIQTVNDYNNIATNEMLYWRSKLRNKRETQYNNLLIDPYKESIALSAQNARTKYEYLDVRTDANLTFENGKYVFKKSEDGDNVMWDDSRFYVFKKESQSTDTKNYTPDDGSFIHVTAYEEFNELLKQALGSDSSKWDADLVKAFAKEWNNYFQEALTTEELQKETKGIIESKIYQLAMSGDLATAKKLVDKFAYSSNPYWTPQEANTIKRNLDYAVRDEVKDIFNIVDETIKNLNLPSKAILEGRFTIPLEKLVYYSDKYTKGEMTIDDIKSEVINTTIEKYNSDKIKDAEDELKNLPLNLNLSSYPSSTDIGEYANILGYGYDIVRNLASGNPIIGSLTEGEFNTIFASMQGYDSKTTYENLNDAVSQELYGCNYSEIDKLKKDDKKNTDTDFLKSVVIKNASSLVYMDKKIEELERVANIVLSDNGKETYDLKPVFFNGDVAIFCPQNGTIYSIPDNTNSSNVFAYTVQPKYISDIENITKSGSVARITNDLLHKDNNGFKLEIFDLYENAFNK